ncbi:uncharacterized protein LOC120457878 [Drosophila santomea]|uniref:uncharacterized protein LOC120457878 n=1 Tax=Drosophila santomea TaxID=129105 RepID=UPI0019548E3A|nr:uncharacterized protein LOC120457878 [Drosophila santomea]
MSVGGWTGVVFSPEGRKHRATGVIAGGEWGLFVPVLCSRRLRANFEFEWGRRFCSFTSRHCLSFVWRSRAAVNFDFLGAAGNVWRWGLLILGREVVAFSGVCCCQRRRVCQIVCRRLPTRPWVSSPAVKGPKRSGFPRRRLIPRSRELLHFSWSSTLRSGFPRRRLIPGSRELLHFSWSSSGYRRERRH